MALLKYINRYTCDSYGHLFTNYIQIHIYYSSLIECIYNNIMKLMPFEMARNTKIDHNLSYLVSAHCSQYNLHKKH